MATQRAQADVELLEKLLLGQLPVAEAERLAIKYADDSRLVELAEAVSARHDALLSTLRNHRTIDDPQAEQLVQRLVSRMKVANASSLANGDTTGLPAETPSEQSPVPEWLEYFHIKKVLGQGGMGTVYLADDTRLDRLVALKTLRREVAANPAARDRFLREARSAARLEHDNIIPIYYVGEADGTPFLAMQYLQGEPLDRRIQRQTMLLTPMPVAEAIRIAKQIAAGLAVAHAQGLIHRDIKPANIWLEDPAGRVKILDFGLARSQHDTTLTASGAVLGTPAYMAPEQGRGLPLDHRADLFSLGSVFYEMLTGKRPFTGPDTMALLTSLALDTPQAPHELNPLCPAELSQVAMQLLAKHPDQRPASATLIVDTLTQLESTIRVATPPAAARAPVSVTEGEDQLGQLTTLAEPSRSASPRRRRLLPFVAVALMLAVVAGGVYGGTILRIANNEGELIVQVDDDSIEVVVKGTTVEILDPSGKRYLVSAGKDGEVEIRQKGTDIVLVSEKFRVKRGDKIVVTVTNDMIAAARKKGTPPTVSPPPVVSPKVDPVEALPAKFKNGLGMEFALVPKGKSWLGGSNTRLGDKEVEFKDSFYLGVYEVTQEEWTSAMGSNPSWYSRRGGGQAAVKDIPDSELKRFPAELMSWDECQQFVTKYNALTREKGWTYRLPTEAEWEYACRGGPMGDRKDSAFDFYFDRPSTTISTDDANIDNRIGRTCRVGRYRPNRLGLYDMHGNVYEWCHDSITGNDGKLRHPVRGGAYFRGAPNSTATKCNLDASEFRNNLCGLRLARVPVSDLNPPSDPSKSVPDYAAIAKGQWIPLLSSDEEYNRLIAEKAHFGPVSKFKFANGILECRNQNQYSGLLFPASSGKDTIFRARVKKLPGQNIALNLRDTGAATDFVCAYFNGGGHFGVGRARNGAWENLKEINLPERYDDYFEFAFAAVGKKLTIYVDGRKILEVDDDLPVEAMIQTGAASVALTSGAGLFKNIEVQILDPDVLAERSAAELVVAAGGSGLVRTISGKEYEIAKAKPLPVHPFRLLRVNLSKLATIERKTLASLAKLPQLEEIILADTAVVDADIAAMIPLPAVRVLNLHGTRVGDESMAYVATFRNLVSLYLDGTRVTDSGMEPLSVLTRLKDLSLWGTSAITDAGIKHVIACQNLTSLNLQGTKVGNGTAAMVTKFPKLNYLNLWGTKIDDVGLAELARCPQLTDLGIGATSVTDAGLVHLAAFPKLKGLALQQSHGKVTNAGLPAIAKCKSLHGVDLSNTAVTDLATLAGAGLHFIDIGFTSVDDAGLAGLQKCPKLKHVVARNTKVTAEGVKKLSEALPRCRIEWNGPAIEPKSVVDVKPAVPEYTAIAKGKWIPVLGTEEDYKKLIAQKSFAKGLWVSGLSTDEDYKKLLAQKSPLLDEVTPLSSVFKYEKGVLECRGGGLLFPTARARDAIIRAKVKKTEGYHIDLRLRSNDKDFTHISYNGGGFFCIGQHRDGWKDLKVITLPGRLDDDYFELAFAAVGRKLTAYVNGWTIMEVEDDLPEGVDEPTGLPGVISSRTLGPVAVGLFKDIEVQILDADGPSALDRRVAEWVFQVGGRAWGSINGEQREVKRGEYPKDSRLTLDWINLADTGVADNDLANLEGLTKLRGLSLHHFTGTKKLTDAAIPHLVKLKSLEELNLWGTRVTDAGVERLTALPKLKQLVLSRTGVTDTGLESLANLADLVNLDLKFTRVTDKGMEHVARLSKLESLGLEATAITDAGLREFAKLKALKHLDLNGATKVSGAGLVAFVKQMPQLTSLHVASTGANDDLLLELKALRNLEGLGLGGTQITDAGLEHLNEFKRLKWLFVKDTKVTAEAVKKLQVAFPNCEIVWSGK